MNRQRTARADGQLEENHPGLFYTLHALDGDRKALRWLETSAPGLYHLCRAVAGREEAETALRSADAVDQGVLAEIMENPDLLKQVRARHPGVYELLRAGRGDAAALRRLRRDRPELARVASTLRHLYRNAETNGEHGRSQELTGDAAADVGQLVGELHLDRGEYARAIEAFTRALEAEPTADAYEGRARAYRALARRDEQQAARLRQPVAAS